MYSCEFTCFRFASTLIVLLCLSLCFVSLIQSSSLFLRAHFSPVCEFRVIVHTAKTGLLRCCFYSTSSSRRSRNSCSPPRAASSDGPLIGDGIHIHSSCKTHAPCTSQTLHQLNTRTSASPPAGRHIQGTGRAARRPPPGRP